MGLVASLTVSTWPPSGALRQDLSGNSDYKDILENFESARLVFSLLTNDVLPKWFDCVVNVSLFLGCVGHERAFLWRLWNLA